MSGPVITGGTIDSIEFRNFAVTQITFSNLALSASALQQAAFLDGNGTDNAAVENLLLPLGWTFNGNAKTDILLAGTTSSDGVALNLSGADTFNLNGGNDNVWMGDGNDKGIGGAGADTIDGGAGNDRVTGGAGNDRQFGAVGNDTINSGTGQDRRNGGSGRDAFVFNLGDGSDQITQFDTERGRVDLAPSLTHSFVDVGGDLAIDYGPGDRILLVGVDFADLGLILIV